jgi:NADH-quinone oxidoreductase subunit L
MPQIVPILWLIPTLPILAAGVISLAPRRSRTLAAALAIGSMATSFLLSLIAFAHTLTLPTHAPETFNFRWFQFGNDWLSLGWMLDPLTAVMLVMVTFVGLLIFIYSTGYMAHDENFTRFFCFLALFAGAMLGVIIANSLLLLFMCWEIVGLTSYLLIGFWYQNPRAAAAAKKAFITTRIGDLGLFLGMVWLYSQSGTLLFYNGGAGVLEPAALAHLVSQTTIFGLTLSSAIGILIFCGAAGKSGQVPLHVWLPDAMEGPTPVSALIHAATMVAAGVFLIARIYPLMSASLTLTPTIALQVVTWVGAITAIFGATIAVAQFDIKRILAYSTVSQLGYMMMGLGVGGVAVGIFHLITHAFFKALLFLGAGSVIHGCSGEQDIRRMGGLRRAMPITFLTYAAGMLALCGFPLFSGFWSKDEILHAAHAWSISQTPFYLGIVGALLTAFYMTRQIYYVFAGTPRLAAQSPDPHDASDANAEDPTPHSTHAPHESPAVMTIPLVILAAFAVLLGFLGTPAWPWFQSFLENAPAGMPATFSLAAFSAPGVLPVMLASSLIVFLGLTLGWLFYGRKPIPASDTPDPLARLKPHTFSLLTHAWYIDALYAATLLRLNAFVARASAWFDRWVFNGLVQLLSYLVLALAWLDNSFDTYVVNTTFDEGCTTVSRSGQLLSQLQAGRIQSYLRIVGCALIALVLFLLWGAKA